MSNGRTNGSHKFLVSRARSVQRGGPRRGWEAMRHLPTERASEEGWLVQRHSGRANIEIEDGGHLRPSGVERHEKIGFVLA